MQELYDEKNKKIGKTGRISVGKFTFEVTIIDHREAYGHTQWLVVPVAGEGFAWVRNLEFIVEEATEPLIKYTYE